jgi:hypothetical protein
MRIRTLSRKACHQIWEPFMRKNALTILSVAVLAAFAGCEKAPERAAERAIESAMEKDGTKAKVDLSSGSARITTTDASGKTSQVEMGAANVTESDIGVPFYPGTKPLEGQATRISTPDGSSVMVALHSDDAPAKVAEFYRERLKTQAEGKQFMDMSGGDGNTTLMLTDDKAKATIQVHVNKADKGTDIQIMANRAAGK